ncbi:uncharacterized protein LOC143032117 isoform X2 [Oratosquilla oratoria]|uniref:uncharacterized protein LOC143032117 isoform X2 n=1 Tax=Oratosquilla oratoria TaxID=337810 RepID=UPI003F75B115
MEEKLNEVDHTSEMFEVERIVDVKNENGPLYRVRWKDFKPADDTWEPEESFCAGSLYLVKRFWERYNKLLEKEMSVLKDLGKPIELAANNVNILRDEVEAVLNNKQGEDEGKKWTYYLLKWKGYGSENNTWEREDELVHAKDLITTYLHQCRVKKSNRERKKAEQKIKEVTMIDYDRQVKEQEFWKSVARGEVNNTTDLYSLVKARRQKQGQKLQPGGMLLRKTRHPPKINHLQKNKNMEPATSVQAGDFVYKDINIQNQAKLSRKQRKKRNCKEEVQNKKKSEGFKKKVFKGAPEGDPHKAKLESVVKAQTSEVRRKRRRKRKRKEDVQNPKKSEKAKKERVCSLLKGLPEYDPHKAQLELMYKAQTTLTLTGPQLIEAISQDDFDQVFACLRGAEVPDIDFTGEFLSCARRGQRDIALLLATHVPCLSAKDAWGDTAFIMAARLGDTAMAHCLLEMGAPMTDVSAMGQSAWAIASENENRHFLRFLREYYQNIVGHAQINYKN